MNELLITYQTLLKESPVIAGAVSLYGLGVITWLFRSVPQRIWDTITHQSTTSLSLLSTGAGSADMQYFSFLCWFKEQGFMKFSRSLAVESTWRRGVGAKGDGQLTAGNGRHYFLWKGRLCWLTKSRVEQSGTTNEITHSLTLTMVGRSHVKIVEALNEFRWVPSQRSSYLYFPSAQGEWSTQRKVTPRKIETVILNDSLKSQILERIDWFLNNRAWYVERGLPYRLVLLFHGPPGTGKSSLLRALASHFQRNLCPVNLSAYNDEGLGNIIRSVPDKSLIVMEDFDSCQAVLSQEWVKDDKMMEGLRLSKSGVLQALDGIDTLDGQIIILTTNYIERIEPSLIREERVNEQYYLGPLNNKAIHKYIGQMFPEQHELTGMEFAPTVGSVLQKQYMLHHQSYRDFIAAIPVINPDVLSIPEKETV